MEGNEEAYTACVGSSGDLGSCFFVFFFFPFKFRLFNDTVAE